MTNLDELKQRAKDTMETIADKSVELYKIAEEKARLLARITKLTTEIAFEKGDLRKHYRELGKMYYDLHQTDPEADMAQMCTEITASLEFIETKQKEIDELKCCVGFDPVTVEMPEDKTDEEIIVEDAEDSAPGNTDDSLKSVQDTDTLEEPEGDAVPGKTPPTFTL